MEVCHGTHQQVIDRLVRMGYAVCDMKSEDATRIFGTTHSWLFQITNRGRSLEIWSAYISRLVETCDVSSDIPDVEVSGSSQEGAN